MERAGGSDDDTLAVHFREAGEWERAGDYARTAADHAAAALAFDRAARLYRLALEFMPHSDPGLAALQCRLADALANGGRGGRAARIYLEAADRSSPARALDLRRRAAEQLLQAGHYAEGVATMRAVVTAVGSKFPDGPRKTLTLLGFERVRLRLRGLGRRIRDARRVDPDELIKLDVFRSVASGLSAHDPATAALFHARHLALALKVGHAAHAACALAAEVAITSLSGERTREKTERIVNAAQALTQRVKSPYPRGLLTMTRGLAAFNMGRWRDAVSLIERAEELLRSECVGAGYEITIGQTFRLIALTHLGDLRALGEGLERYLNAANERDNLWADTTLRAGPQNMCWLAADDTRRARGELIRVGKRWPEGGFSLQRILTVIAKVHIELYSGEGGEAWGRVTGRWAEMTQEFFHEWQWLRITMVHLRACAALVRVVEEGSARERAGLLRGADADARVLLRERALWARPLAETLQAAVDELEGLRDAAIGRLQSAEQGFRTVDMHLHAAVARYRRGQLLGAQGQETRESALAYLEDQGVAAPVRMARLIAPGFSRLEE
ncbi:MAG: hypothetical protein R3A51_11665 [Nannocystaceae bacterium]